MRFFYLILAFSMLAAGTFTLSAKAADALNKSEVETIIKEYLLENPEVLIESLENFRTQQERDQQANAKKSIEKHIEYLTSADAPSVGPADADVVVVEFFDYNCGYCRRAVPDIQKLIKEDTNVRFVFREMPILSPNSRDVARWSIAAHKQDKYFEFHAALMEKRGNRSPAVMKEMAEELGLDADKLEKDANSAAVKKMLEKDVEVARAIGIRGTPAFIIGGDLYPGYLGEDGLRQTIENARKNSDKKDG